MIFMSYWFAIFVASFFLCYRFVPLFAFRKALVIGFGILFQVHFAGAAGVLPIIFLAVITFLAGLSRSRHLQILSIIVCVSALLFYKYTLFFASELLGFINPALAKKSIETLTNSILPAAPPLAISFFVFEFVHYLTEVLKGERPIRSVPDFLSFALFWPTMVAGPIKRYTQFLPSIEEGVKHVNSVDVMFGMSRVAVGIIKKFIADNLTAMITFHVASFDALPIQKRWVIFFAIGLRILLDFSGYTDMAIGFSRMMGIKVPENFNWPYLATGVINFWHRWHISLSTWIRDYIYIPLGGGRVSLPRKLANGMLAFAICGLWHGAGWNFIVWGLYHGAGITINNLWKLKTAQYTLPQAWVLPAQITSWFVTLMFVFVGWIFFFYPVSKAVEMLGLMVGIK